MRKETHLIIWIAVTILVILLGSFLIGVPFVYNKSTDIDINSGDIRIRTVVFSFIKSEKIEQTPFSKEVRRLGIPIDENRSWKYGSSYILTIGGHSQSWISYLICETIVKMFNDIDMPDDERKAILQKVLMSLQTGNHDDIVYQYSVIAKRMKPVGPSLNKIERGDVNEQ